MNSILDEVKKICNVDEDETDFDTEIILDINGEFAKLFQLGAGPKDGFFIEDNTAQWEDFTEDPVLLALVKSYVKAAVKIKFDPPKNSTHMESLKASVAENEWRILTHQEVKLA